MQVEVVYIADPFYQALFIQRFYGLRAKTVDIHGPAANKMHHLTHDLRRTAILIRAIKGGFALFALQRDTTGRTGGDIMDWLCARLSFFQVNLNYFGYDLSAFFYVNPIALM